MNDEARRQQALYAEIAGDGAAGRGLRAWRANAAATAGRALAAVYPTLRAMLGDDAFRALAIDHWRDSPPLRGDLGEWGGDLPDALAARGDLADWPWLADAARLDLACHRCERAADEVLDAPSIERLREADPARVRLVMRAGVALVASVHPVATLRRAQADGDLEPARRAIAEGRAEAALVARRGWRAEVTVLDAAAVPFTRAVLAGDSLAAALDAAGEAFDLAAWLAQALRGEWLKGSGPWPDERATPDSGTLAR